MLDVKAETNHPARNSNVMSTNEWQLYGFNPNGKRHYLRRIIYIHTYTYILYRCIQFLGIVKIFQATAVFRNQQTRVDLNLVTMKLMRYLNG